MTHRLLVMTLLAGAVSSAAADQEGTRGFAATVQPLATAAALEAFAEGGNAIDAAVAAGLTLGVVDGHNSGIYSWEYLYDLGHRRERLWLSYLDRLKAAGASPAMPTATATWPNRSACILIRKACAN